MAIIPINALPAWVGALTTDTIFCVGSQSSGLAYKATQAQFGTLVSQSLTAGLDIAITGAGTISLAAPANAEYLYTNSGGTLVAGTFPVHLYGQTQDGTLTANQSCLRLYPATAYTFPAGLTGSTFYAEAAATANATLTLKNNGSSVGTVVFPASSAVGTASVSSSFTVSPGNPLTLTAPASPDATLAGVSATLVGTR